MSPNELVVMAASGRRDTHTRACQPVQTLAPYGAAYSKEDKKCSNIDSRHLRF